MKSKDTKLLSRREFNALGTLSLFVTSSGVSALDATTSLASAAGERTAKLRDGSIVLALGQGSAGFGQGRHPQAAEEEALRTLAPSAAATSLQFPNPVQRRMSRRTPWRSP